MKRKRYSKEFKARVALEAIKGQKTAAELASEYEVHVSQINTWKKQALAALPEVFGQGEAREEAQREAEADAGDFVNPCVSHFRGPVLGSHYTGSDTNGEQYER